ncbi:hypothetical protein TcBrA4_0049040 [Trypanosoma cruzi]|nr:hypothetical protein TcBrA4_0049040 [Trypanosoma cruzi]
MGRGPHHDGTHHWKDGRGIFRGRRGATRPYENVDGCGICCGDRSGDVADSSAARGYATRARDALQEKCIRLAFCRAFPHNNRVRVHTTFLTIAGVDFILVERTITGLRRRGVPCEPRRVGACSSRSGQCPHCGSWGGCAPPGGDHFRACGSSVSSTRRMVWSAGRLLWRLHLKQFDGDCGHVTAFAHDGERFWLVEPKTCTC